MWNLIATIFLLEFAIGCDTSYSFDYSSCSVDMNYFDGNCNSFNLVNCTWYQCSLQVYIDGEQTCVDYQMYNTYDWNNCIQTCCNSGSSYAQTSDGISQCQTYITIKQNLLPFLMMVLSAICILLLVVILIMMCRNIRNQLNLAYQQHPQDPQPEDQNWQELNSANALSERNFCTVCLEEDGFFELECHHVFHRQCIITCIKNKKECIICKRAALEKVTVYCQKCFKFYYDSSLSKFLYSSVNTKQICPKCKNEISNL